MRTIKFRAWDKKDKRMYGEGNLKKLYGTWILEVENPDPKHILVDGDDYEIDPYIPLDEEDFELMQFTGLLDKSSKEIWEGDLVELENWEQKRYEVVFNRGGFCLKFGKDSHFYPDIKYAEDSIVIGNVYENPNLITL